MFFQCFVLTGMGTDMEEHTNCYPHVSLQFRARLKEKPCESWAAERRCGRFGRYTDSLMLGTERGQLSNTFPPNSQPPVKWGLAITAEYGFGLFLFLKIRENF